MKERVLQVFREHFHLDEFWWFLFSISQFKIFGFILRTLHAPHVSVYYSLKRCYCVSVSTCKLFLNGMQHVRVVGELLFLHQESWCTGKDFPNLKLFQNTKKGFYQFKKFLHQLKKSQGKPQINDSWKMFIRIFKERGLPLGTCLAYQIHFSRHLNVLANLPTGIFFFSRFSISHPPRTLWQIDIFKIRQGETCKGEELFMFARGLGNMSQIGKTFFLFMWRNFHIASYLSRWFSPGLSELLAT